MADFRMAFKAMYGSVVGLGTASKYPECQILGSGFVVHPDGWILTNRHVLEALLATRSGAAFLCVQSRDALGAVGGMAMTGILEAAFPPADPQSSRPVSGDEAARAPSFKGLDPVEVISPEPPDIGVCRIHMESLPPEALPLTPARIVHSRAATVGRHVAVIGFPQGLHIPESYASRSQLQLTPLMQTGIVSGILPFPGVEKPDALVLDMLVNPGSSGSPVFLEDGTVVGLVCATRVAFQALETLDAGSEAVAGLGRAGVYAPSGLGLAVPSSQFPEQWVAE